MIEHSGAGGERTPVRPGPSSRPLGIPIAVSADLIRLILQKADSSDKRSAFRGVAPRER